MSVGLKLAALAAVAVAMLAVSGFAAIWGLGRLDDAMDDVAVTLDQIREHALVDQNHDAIRGDVLLGIEDAQTAGAPRRADVT
jgi:hypothetical protein